MKKITTYPSPLSTWAEKKDKAYGLAYAQAISKDWFNGGLISDGCEYGVRKNKIRENRLYVRGENPVEKSKKLFEKEDGDLSMANLDWRIINRVRKFCRIVSNGIGDDKYRLDIRTNDRFSVKIRKDEREKHLTNMRSVNLLKEVQGVIGVDMMPKGFVPRDKEELEIYEQLKEKSKIEIFEEIMIDYVKKTNNYKNIEQTKNIDLTDNGIAAIQIYTDNREGIKLRDIDIEELIHSSVKKNNFSDAHYFGYVDTITLSDLQRESNFDDAVLRKIAPTYSRKNGHSADYSKGSMADFLGYKIDVLRFAFKTSKTNVYKKVKRKGKTIKLSKKDENFNPPKRNDYERISSVKDTWMEGTYVIGTEYIYDYKESENVIRDEQNKARPPFVVRAVDIYENRLHAFLDDIKPLVDELQEISMKLKHLRSEIKPDLIIIDEDVLADVDGEGNKVGFHKETLNILNVKGIIINKRVDMGEMGIKDGSPARPMASSQGSGIAPLLNLYATIYNEIRDVTGINPARDGSIPHDALLGVNQMAQLASNTATQHIVDAAIDFNKRVAETISSRLHAIFRNPNAKHLRKLYERAVGKKVIDGIEVLKDRHLHDFGFTVEMIPTQQELQELKEDIGLYLQQGLISPEIKSEAMRIAKINIKLANQYLAYMSKRRQEKAMEQQRQTMQQKTQGDMMAAKQASEGRIQEEGIKTKMKIQYETIMSKIRVAEKQAMQQIEAPVKDKEFEQDVYLKRLESLSRFDETQFKETAKDERLKKQSTHQSKLIDQRKGEKEPIDFENEFYL